MLISGTERRKPQRPWWRWLLRMLLRIRPRRRHLHGSLAHRMMGSRLLEPHLWIPDRDSAAKGAAIGMFFGMLPLPGLQILPSMLVCVFTRSNIAVAALATFGSNPFTAPAIIYLQIKLGQWMLPALAADEVVGDKGLAKFLTFGKPLLLGSLTMAVLGALVAYLTILGIWRLGVAAARRRRDRRDLHKNPPPPPPR